LVGAEGVDRSPVGVPSGHTDVCREAATDERVLVSTSMLG